MDGAGLKSGSGRSNLHPPLEYFVRVGRGSPCTFVANGVIRCPCEASLEQRSEMLMSDW